MIIRFNHILSFGILFSLCLSSTQKFWDLGVVIDTNESMVVQREVDPSTIGFLDEDEDNIEQIMAFRANNFIAPILHNLKYPIISAPNRISKNEEFIFSLTTKDAVNHIKRSFLNEQFGKFFSLYGQIKINEVSKIENINTLYIQNLYKSNQYSVAKSILDKISQDQLTVLVPRCILPLRNVDRRFIVFPLKYKQTIRPGACTLIAVHDYIGQQF